jgi:hypothetical protein
MSVLLKGRIAPAWAALAEKSWGSIGRDGFPARLGAHREGGLYEPVRLLVSLPPQVLLLCRYFAWRIGKARAVYFI